MSSCRISSYKFDACRLKVHLYLSSFALLWVTLGSLNVYWRRRYDMDLRDERELAFQRLLCICQSGLVSITDFRCWSLRKAIYDLWMPAHAPLGWQTPPLDVLIHQQHQRSAIT